MNNKIKESKITKKVTFFNKIITNFNFSSFKYQQEFQDRNQLDTILLVDIYIVKRYHFNIHNGCSYCVIVTVLHKIVDFSDLVPVSLHTVVVFHLFACLHIAILSTVAWSYCKD